MTASRQLMTGSLRPAPAVLPILSSAGTVRRLLWTSSSASPALLRTRCCTNPPFTRADAQSVRAALQPRGLLIRCASRRSLSSASSSSASATSDPPQRTTVILGGGITGLSSALYLSRSLPPSHRIVLLEREKRLGGWVQSERITIKGKEPAQEQTALIEGGPRSLRPAGYSGLIMLDMIRSLGLWDRMLLVPKTAPSARNRYIWYADQLNKLPSSLSGLSAVFKLPVLRGVVREIFTKEWRTPSRFARPRSESPEEQARWRKRELLEDESIEAFVMRRHAGGSKLARNVISAVMHGIYAGDLRRLSVRSIARGLWDAEREHASLVRRFLFPRWANRRYRAPSEEVVQMRAWEAQALEQAREKLGKEAIEQMKGISVFSFPQGLAEIPEAMRRELEGRSNVEIRCETEVQAIESGEEAVQIRTSSGESIACDRVVSTLPGTALVHLLQPPLPSQHLVGASGSAAGTSANVGVVNVVIPSWRYAPRERLLTNDVEGFGFLIPRSVQPNKDGILGVVFDSDSLPEQDAGADGKAGTPTKFTVMMGGAHWQDLRAEQLPSEAEMKRAAQDVIHRCLQVPRELLEDGDGEGTTIKVHVQRDCIPWYTVGHPVRMARLHRAIVGAREEEESSYNQAARRLESGRAPQQEEEMVAGQGVSPWNGKLALVGAAFNGVSMNDCVARSGETMQAIIDEELELAASSAQHGSAKGTKSSKRSVTGLELWALQCGML